MESNITVEECGLEEYQFESMCEYYAQCEDYDDYNDYSDREAVYESRPKSFQIWVDRHMDKYEDGFCSYDVNCYNSFNDGDGGTYYPCDGCEGMAWIKWKEIQEKYRENRKRKKNKAKCTARG